MAAESPNQRLQEEATCSICLDFFTEPVILDCGHSFCQACIARSWETPAAALCPQCRESVQPRWKPNRQLGSFAEIARQIRDQEKGGPGAGQEAEEGVCGKHREPLKLFCRDDGAPICVVCDRAKEHRDHNVVPVEEAAQEYKEDLCSCLDILRKEREQILAFTRDTEQKSQDLLEVTKSERQTTLAKFRKLYQFLEEQEQILLAQMKEVEKEITRERDEQLAKLSVELSSLENIIQEVEEKIQKPARDLLKDVRSILQRCEKEKFENPATFPPTLKWRIWDFCDLNAFLEGVMKQFKDTLESGVQQQEAIVTLDPDTAHPHLALSEDRKSVRRGDKYQDLPDNPERFDKRWVVLGCERFSTGRHCWDVTVGSEEGWAMGVVRTSVKRKGKIIASPEEGFWALRTWNGGYKPFIPSFTSLLTFSGGLRRIRVSLNYAGGASGFLRCQHSNPSLYILRKLLLWRDPPATLLGV